MKKILIVVDMQNDFIDGVLGTKEAQSIVDNVCEKIKNADKETLILCTQDTHCADYLSTEEGKNLPVEHCIMFTKGWNFNDKIAKALSEYNKKLPKDENSIEDCKNEVICMHKPTFGSLGLSNYLLDEGLKNEITEIELVGLCTDICVISNAVMAKAAVPNAHIIVDAACCAGVIPESHDTAIKAMKTLQIEIKNENKEPWRNNE